MILKPGEEILGTLSFAKLRKKNKRLAEGIAAAPERLDAFHFNLAALVQRNLGPLD